MDDLKNFNNEELIELYQKIDEEIQLLKTKIIDESSQEEKAEDEESEDDKS